VLRAILQALRDRRAGPEERAEALLLAHLTREQRDTYLAYGWFDLRGRDGSLWTIARNGGTRNVTCLCRNGRRVYCTYLDDVPRADVLLSQKLAIEATGGRGLPRRENGVLVDEHLLDLPPPRFGNIGAPGALVLEEAAAGHRKRGELGAAERRLRQALDVAIPAERPHVLNGLALVLVRTAGLYAAWRANAEAWRLLDGAHDVTSARVLLVRVAFRILAGDRNVGLYFGQLKTLLARPSLSRWGGVARHWDVDDALNLLRMQLRNEGELLVQATRVLDGCAAPGVLDVFDAWTAAPAVGLDVPWPDS